jgi:hypothetical protein
LATGMVLGALGAALDTSVRALGDVLGVIPADTW